MQRSLNSPKQYLLPISVIASVAIIGVAVLLQSHAATPVASFEAEQGTLTAPAIQVNDSTASNNSAVKFSAPISHDYVQDFNTPVASWPSDGSAPTGYSGFCAYADGTNGTHNAPSVYWPSKVVSVHDGYMDFYDHNSQAAAILPFCYSGFLYGTYTVTMRVTADGTDKGGTYPGYHNAFLLWPNDGNGSWPTAGEFDYPESDTSLTNPYMAVVQPDSTFLPSTTTRTPKPWSDGNWHTYTQQWGPGFVAMYQDGILLGKVTSGIPTWKMHPVLQNEWYTTPDPSITGHTEVTRVTYDKSYTVDPSQFN